MIRVALSGIGFFLLLHLCGFREDVGFLSGTVPTTAISLLCGLAYAASWFFAVLVAPVMLLTSLTTRRWPSTPPS